MNISSAGLAFICSFEGFSSKPYLDSAGIPTIGFGTITYANGKKVTMKDKPITKEDAMKEVLFDINSEFVPWVNKYIPSLKQHEFDAVVSLIYNVGTGNIKDSTIRRRILSNDTCANVTEAFLMWNKARVRGVLRVISGLTRRRQAEAKIYCTGKYN